MRAAAFVATLSVGAAARELQGSGTLLTPWAGWASGSPIPAAADFFVAAGADASGGALYPCRYRAGSGNYLAGTTRGLPVTGGSCSVAVVAMKVGEIA